MPLFMETSWSCPPENGCKKEEKTLHMDITRWSTPKPDWLYYLQPKMEKFYIVSKNKTRSWLWLRSWTPYCQIQTRIVVWGSQSPGYPEEDFLKVHLYSLYPDQLGNHLLTVWASLPRLHIILILNPGHSLSCKEERIKCGYIKLF